MEKQLAFIANPAASQSLFRPPVPRAHAAAQFQVDWANESLQRYLNQ